MRNMRKYCFAVSRFSHTGRMGNNFDSASYMFHIRGSRGKGKKMTQNGLWLDLGYKLVKYDQVSVIGYDCEKSCFRFYIERKGSRQKEAFLIVRKYDFRRTNVTQEELADFLNSALRVILMTLIREANGERNILDLPQLCGEVLRRVGTGQQQYRCMAM